MRQVDAPLFERCVPHDPRWLVSTSVQWNDLPERVFVSHSYDDVERRDALLQRLPAHVEPVVWPRQEEDPTEAVSDGIVEEILACDGLIYLEGGQSEGSMWVNFERDYARRSGRRVFAFDAESHELRADRGRPVPLNARLLISRGQEAQAAELLEWMKEERGFALRGGATCIRMKEIGLLVAELLADSSAVLWLLDARLSGIAQMAFQVPVEMILDHFSFLRGNGNAFYSEHDLDGYVRWLLENSMYVRLTRDWEPTRSDDPDIQQVILSEFPMTRHFYSGWAVDLPNESGTGIDWNRADDLIIRLTLMLQRVHPFLPDEEMDP